MFKFLFLLFLPLMIGAGEPPVSPLNIPISFSGNYGELRNGRFHGGLDFRVGGGVGEKIYSIEEGYVYRVSVSPVGYGNGLYIKHPDGTISIYGHMLEFAPEIAKRVKAEQYRKQKFSVNLFFEPDEFPVHSHQFIGRVGNSGSSGAPHLHLELRDSSGNGPVNPIKRGYFDIKDQVPPIIQRVNFYSYTDTIGVPQTSLIRSFEGKNQQILHVGEKSYVAIDAIDKQAGTVAKLAVETYEVFVDDSLLYRFDVGDYTYEMQQSFNSLIEYREKMRSGVSMVKTWVESGNEFAPAKINSRDNGLIVLKDNEIHVVKVKVADQFGNSASRSFKVRRGGDSTKVHSFVAPAENHLYSIFLPWFAPFAYAGNGINVSFPVETFFSSIYFTIDASAGANGAYSSLWRIGDSEIAMKNVGKIEISASVPQKLQSKAFIAAVSSDGSISYCGGKYSNGAVKGKISSLGTYCVEVDTIPPIIEPRFNNPAAISRVGQAAFTIKDDLSGINTYSATIDGEWVLACYDKKYDKLWIRLDRDVISKRGEHTLILTVTDNKDNTSTYKTDFKW